MYGNEKIRHVHIVEHSEVENEFRVGCVCAENMTNDYYNPVKKRELRNDRSSRLKNLHNRKWKLSYKGNSYLKIENHLLVIFKDKFTQQFKVIIDNTTGSKLFENLEKAKLATFKGIEHSKKRKMVYNSK